MVKRLSILGILGIAIGCSVYFLAYRPVTLAPISSEAPKEQPKAHNQLTLLFVGDIMLSRAVGERITKYNDPTFPFLKSADILRAADFTFGNLENPVSDRGTNMGSIYSFRAEPRVIDGLAYSGFDMVSLANNHMWDYGPEALEDTVNVLHAQNINSIGAGKNAAEANRLVIKDINGVTLGILGFTTLYPKSLEATEDSAGVSSFDIKKISERIKEIKNNNIADILVISLHWGEEYQTISNAFQQDIAHQLITAGADLIIGHHPHVPQEIEHYHDGWIFYSLGNFVFDQTFSEATMSGIAARIAVVDKKIQSAESLRIRINKDYQPVFED